MSFMLILHCRAPPRPLPQPHVCTLVTVLSVEACRTFFLTLSAHVVTGHPKVAVTVVLAANPIIASIALY